MPGAKTGRWLHYFWGSPADINDLNGNMFSLHFIGLTGVQLGVLMDLIVSLLEGCHTIWQRFKLKSCWNHLGNSCLSKFSSFYTWSLSSLYWICLDAALAGCIVNSNVFLFTWFRPLRGFDLVKDRDTGNSKGYGFCVYQVTLQGHISWWNSFLGMSITCAVFVFLLQISQVIFLAGPGSYRCCYCCT